ncbi:hypothetical protein CDV36_015290 [Fusarium kuroshium]|uniref:4-hydroxy-4-methyl-2-oxoglutarate aldolase n=1 Tax=Fusarium kuroshium TaxID=2010991 RepID=A0A3M2RB15_9HYPO|nr:hypothetical protein CDV36_015290 [Fusarium kuroshium]
MSMEISSMSLNEKLDIISQYSACDVADALVRLQKGQGPPFGGHLAGPFLVSGSPADQAKVVGPAMTVRYASIHSAETAAHGRARAPSRGQYVDAVSPGAVVVIAQEQGLSTALLGANMATRMKLKGAKAVVAAGNIRDVGEIQDIGLPIWAQGSSPVAYSAESKVIEVDAPITAHRLRIDPGDIIFCDGVEGIVRIPLALLDDVISLVPKLAEADNLIHRELLQGTTFADSTAKHPK